MCESYVLKRDHWPAVDIAGSVFAYFVDMKLSKYPEYRVRDEALSLSESKVVSSGRPSFPLSLA